MEWNCSKLFFIINRMRNFVKTKSHEHFNTTGCTTWLLPPVALLYVAGLSRLIWSYTGPATLSSSPMKSLSNFNTKRVHLKCKFTSLPQWDLCFQFAQGVFLLRPFYSFIFLSESFHVCLDAGTTERLRSSSPNKVLTNLLSAIIFSYLCEVGWTYSTFPLVKNNSDGSNLCFGQGQED